MLKLYVGTKKWIKNKQSHFKVWAVIIVEDFDSVM
jgi:hypothetical protein